MVSCVISGMMAANYAHCSSLTISVFTISPSGSHPRRSCDDPAGDRRGYDLRYVYRLSFTTHAMPLCDGYVCGHMPFVLCVIRQEIDVGMISVMFIVYRSPPMPCRCVMGMCVVTCRLYFV